MLLSEVNDDDDIYNAARRPPAAPCSRFSAGAAKFVAASGAERLRARQMLYYNITRVRRHAYHKPAQSRRLDHVGRTARAARSLAPAARSEGGPGGAKRTPRRGATTTATLYARRAASPMQSESPA